MTERVQSTLFLTELSSVIFIFDRTSSVNFIFDRTQFNQLYFWTNSVQSTLFLTEQVQSTLFLTELSLTSVNLSSARHNLNDDVITIGKISRHALLSTTSSIKGYVLRYVFRPFEALKKRVFLKEHDKTKQVQNPEQLWGN